MKSKFALVLLYSVLINTTLAWAQSAQENFNKYFKLLPQPQKTEFLKGTGLASGNLKNVTLSGNAEKPVMYGELASLPISKKSGAGSLTLKIATTNVPDHAEAYVLEVKAGQATVTARTKAGLFYGCQTLNQLLEDSKDQKVTIPAVVVSDYPDINYRSVHLDLKHHLDSTSNYYKMIDRLAQLKVNAMIIEFEDKLKYKKAPVIGASNALSIEEVIKLSNYAQERNIEISPLVQGLGHAPFILKHPEYKELRDDPKSDWAFCALNPKTYELQFKLYEDAMEATPNGKYLHIGGDEVGELGKSELAKKSGMSPFQLQMYWLNKVTEFAKKHNRIPIFWDDMIWQLSGLYRTTYDGSLSEEESKAIWAKNRHKLDENIKLFPENCVFMRWNYGSQHIWGNKEALNWYKSKNLRSMAATAAQTNTALMPRLNSKRGPIKSFCEVTKEKSLDGILCTTWEDSSPHSETFFRGFHFFGIYSWNVTKEVSPEEGNLIFRHRFYGPAVSSAYYEFQNTLEESLPFWETALVDQGERDKSRRPFELMTLPDRNIPGEWRKKYRDRLALARNAMQKYNETKAKIDEVSKLAVRNQYHLELMNEINELQIYPAKLILLFEKFDRAPTLGKIPSVIAIREYVENFKTIRANYERVFSQTRILNAPDDYLLDSNKIHPHMANAKTSDWMYRFELAMNEKLNQWFTNFDF